MTALPLGLLGPLAQVAKGVQSRPCSFADALCIPTSATLILIHCRQLPDTTMSMSCDAVVYKGQTGTLLLSYLFLITITIRWHGKSLPRNSDALCHLMLYDLSIFVSRLVSHCFLKVLTHKLTGFSSIQNRSIIINTRVFFLQ
jgi:hypothetical protein